MDAVIFVGLGTKFFIGWITGYVNSVVDKEIRNKDTQFFPDMPFFSNFRHEFLELPA